MLETTLLKLRIVLLDEQLQLASSLLGQLDSLADVASHFAACGPGGDDLEVAVAIGVIVIPTSAFGLVVNATNLSLDLFNCRDQGHVELPKGVLISYAIPRHVTDSSFYSPAGLPFRPVLARLCFANWRCLVQAILGERHPWTSYVLSLIVTSVPPCRKASSSRRIHAKLKEDS
jgi:hypothetical protein